MPAPNMFIVYVSDVPAAARFYGDLFDMRPSFETPGFVAFDLAGGVQLALWNFPKSELERATVRTSEVCLHTPERRGDRRSVSGVAGQSAGRLEPHDEKFGRTFVSPTLTAI